MTPDNPDLQELKRLWEAAKITDPWTVEIEEYGNSGMVTVTGLERVLHDTDWADHEDFQVDQDRAHWIAGITNAFPALLERLERAEAERDELRRGIESANSAARIYHDKLTQAQAELPEYTSRMKREGVLEGLESALTILSSSSDDPEVDIRQAAKRLREVE